MSLPFGRKASSTLFWIRNFIFPQQERGQLSTHSYFPNRFGHSGFVFEPMVEQSGATIGDYAIRMQVNAVSSPAIVPKKWGPDVLHALR
jgi:hypothetical protein